MAATSAEAMNAHSVRSETFERLLQPSMLSPPRGRVGVAWENDKVGATVIKKSWHSA